MITDADIKKLKESFSDTFATKDDLSDLKDQFVDTMSGKLAAQEQNILNAVDTKLSAQKKAIVKDVAEYIVDVVVPLFDKQNRKFTKIEHHLGISLAESAL